MSTSASITTAFKTQFHDTFFHAVQQKESRFQGSVFDRGMVTGSQFTTNNLGLVEAREVTGRYQDKQASDIDHATRIASMVDFDIGPLVVDSFDLAKLTADPTFKYVELMVAAANRRKDRTIYRALLDAAPTRVLEGGAITNTTIPAGQQIAAGGTGMTRAKILQALQLFRAAEADSFNGEELYMAYDGVMLRQLLTDTTLTSSDFMSIQMLMAGKLSDTWCGFTWLPYNLLDVPSANVSRTVAWAKSSLQFGTGIDVKTDVDQNRSKRGHPTEIYGWMSLGAVRQDEKKVVQIDFASNV